MSRTKRHKSQRDQCVEWGNKRLGNKNYLGSPGKPQKQETNRRERLAAKRETFEGI